MGASTREEIIEVFDVLDADAERLCAFSFDVFTPPERLRALERLEEVTRRLRSPQHTLINELAAQAGKEELGGTEVIRMASHAHHYLAIFEHGKALALYHTKRLASPAQRIALYGKERGCTKPRCDAPAYHPQVHHVNGWKTPRRTHIDELTLACGPHNRLIEQGGFTTRKNTRGDTEWIPPAHLDHGQPRTNTFHHPEKLLAPNDDEDDP